MKRVNYNGLIVDIREEDLQKAINILSCETTSGRSQILKSVDNSLQKVLKMVKEKKPISPQILKNTANDICIWFANEAMEGRAEKYRTTLQ